MSLRKKIFIRSVLLCVFLIILIIVVHGVNALKVHHQLMDERYTQEVVTRATEVDRLILWEDHVAVTKLLKSLTAADDCVAYAFVEREGHPYAQTFPDGVPRMLLGRPASPTPEQWCFKDEYGAGLDDFFIQVRNSDAVLHIGLSRDEMAEEMAPTLMRIAIIGAVSILLAILLSMFLANWTTREVNNSTAALRESEASLREAQLIAKLGNWRWESHGNKVQWSDEIYSICGFEKGTTPDMENIRRRTIAEDLPVLDTAFQELEKGGVFNSIEYRFIKPPDLAYARKLYFQTVYLMGKLTVDLNKKLEEWERFYNFGRPRGAFNGKTPYEVLRSMLL